MKIKLHNNDNTDEIVYEGTLEEIREVAKERIKLPTWDKGWSEVIEE